MEFSLGDHKILARFRPSSRNPHKSVSDLQFNQIVSRAQRQQNALGRSIHLPNRSRPIVDLYPSASEKCVSEQVVQASWNVAASASATASFVCVPTWHEDFREDLARIDVPTLVIQGDADRILPITATGSRTAKPIKGACLLIVKGGPHCITWTHAEEVNAGLLSFLGEKTGIPRKDVA
jgi:pimeloyl-ACP methyl ester carboxylesterase